MKAMIFAAGLGTRLRPLTDTKPKALVEINGVTLLEITIKRLIQYGFDDIVINVHHFSQQIIDFLKSKKNFGITINISDETDLLLDTGGGLKKAAPLLSGNGPILIHNVDIVSDIDLRQLYSVHIENKSLATLACMERNSSRQFLINNKNELCGWRNNKTGELKIPRLNEDNLKPVSFCGIHVVSPEIFNLIIEEGVFSIVDLYLRLAKKSTICINVFKNRHWIDVGTTEKLTKAANIIK
jgi:N-acetyl-alpha-D-muramate 1-phosphate uridylyltransferase